MDRSHRLHRAAAPPRAVGAHCGLSREHLRERRPWEPGGGGGGGAGGGVRRLQLHRDGRVLPQPAAAGLRPMRALPPVGRRRSAGRALPAAHHSPGRSARSFARSLARSPSCATRAASGQKSGNVPISRVLTLLLLSAPTTHQLPFHTARCPTRRVLHQAAETGSAGSRGGRTGDEVKTMRRKPKIRGSYGPLLRRTAACRCRPTLWLAASRCPSEPCWPIGSPA